jgi:hypothetical protein
MEQAVASFELIHCRKSSKSKAPTAKSPALYPQLRGDICGLVREIFTQNEKYFLTKNVFPR